MAKAIKLPDGYYWDSSSVSHDRKILDNILKNDVLYDNSGGSNNINLNVSLSNYEYIEIFSQCNVGGYDDERLAQLPLIKIYDPVGKSFNLTHAGYNVGISLTATTFDISEKNIKASTGVALYINSALKTEYIRRQMDIKITKIVGYKHKN